MSNPSTGGEPSMEEILASIRALVQDTTQQTTPPGAPAPPQQQQQPANVPGTVNPAAANKPTPPLGGQPAPSHSGAPVTLNAEAASDRPDEDDLADLLDEPLPASGTHPPAPTAGSSVSAAWHAPANSPAAKSNGAAATPMSFDFGSMVPSRDPAPRLGSDSAPMPPLSHLPAAGLTASPGLNAAADSVLPGWPQSMRDGQNGAATGSTQATEMGAPQAKPVAASPAPLAPKPALNGSSRSASEAHVNPVREGDKPAPGSPNAQQEPGRYFSAPGTNSAAPVAKDSQPAPASHSAEHKPAALAPPAGAGASLGQAITPALGREDAPTPSFLRRGGNSSSPGSISQVASSAEYPSIEPVLKAFGKIETKVGHAELGQTSGRAIAAESVTGSKAKAATSSPFSDLASAPEAASKSAASTVKSGHDGIGERSLEDAIMHLLRPMLREWLDDNLPRIVEDAVRREIADAVKDKIAPVSKL